MIGGNLGRFRIVERLGRGGMASVYKAFDPRFERHVALKVLSLDLAADPNFRQRFEREMKTLARLDHPNIAQIHDSGEEGETFYMVLQYFPDGDLRSRLAQRLPLYEVVRILREIAKGLAHAHRIGIVHRDIKPANVLFSSEGRPVLADFGIAKLMAETVQFTQEMSGPGVGIGTPQYMSPEQVQGKEIDARSDVYAFGVLAYEMFVGQPPFMGDTPIAVALKHLNDDFPRPTMSVPDFPPLVEDFILKCVARDPEDRFENGTALVAALEAIARGSDAHAADFPTVALRLDAANPTTATMRRDDAAATSPTMTMPSVTPRPAPKTGAPTPPTRAAATRASTTSTTAARATSTGARPATRFGKEGTLYPPAASEPAEEEWQSDAAPARKRTGLVIALVAIGAVVAALVGFVLTRKDATPPGAVALDAGNATSSTVELTWRAPGDNGNSGQARAYELRQSDGPISAADWESYRGVAGVGTPRPAGDNERLVVTGLDPQRDYFFALRSRDDAGNWSAISNVASARTLAPPRAAPGAGTLIVRTTPADATVIVDGGALGRGPEARFDSLTAGAHTVEVMYDGHATDRRSATVLAGLTESIEIVLVPTAAQPAAADPKGRDTAADTRRAPEKSPPAEEAAGGKGTLEIRTDIAARILVDGEVKKENGDVVRLSLDTGTHRVRIEKDGFVPKDTSVVVTSKRPTTVNMTIERNLATIEITSNVAAALIIDDDVKEVNSGFARARVSPGRHTVRAEAAGYPTQEREIDVATGGVAEVEFEFTAEKRGSLRVTVKGEQAIFFIDGVKADCPTPCVVENISPGTHKLVAERGGVRGEMSILIRAGERLDVDVTPLFLGK
ncbi:MAG: protein kinase domain-containing protein [bacterium]